MARQNWNLALQRKRLVMELGVDWCTSCIYPTTVHVSTALLTTELITWVVSYLSFLCYIIAHFYCGSNSCEKVDFFIILLVAQLVPDFLQPNFVIDVLNCLIIIVLVSRCKQSEKFISLKNSDSDCFWGAPFYLLYYDKLWIRWSIVLW